MELIKKKTKKRGKTPHYKLYISFMEGDADGYQTKVVKFNEGDIESLKATIMAVARCNAAYPNGMGGYDEYFGLPEYDAFFDEDADEDIIDKYNPARIYIEHPRDCNYLSTSFDGYSLIHFDENSNETQIEIKFTEEELKYIKEAGKILK